MPSSCQPWVRSSGAGGTRRGPGRWDSPAYDPGSPWVDTPGAATVGFGHIGARCWQRFRAFGARGVAVTRRGGEPLHNVVVAAR
ncbi:hypothetical protein ABZ547_09200 [Streptomyces sparsogenes]|uniref:hypothetical protein n=1 Tax=Streptomyces sparsogenes TaxID=67365 RepID=UPI0033E0581B